MRKLILIHLSLLALSGCMADHTFAAPPSPIVGGYGSTSVASPDVIAATKFALAAEQKALSQSGKHPAEIRLVRINQANQQVVAGLNYELALTVTLDGVEKKAVAVVYQSLPNNQPPYSLTSWVWQ